MSVCHPTDAGKDGNVYTGPETMETVHSGCLDTQQKVSHGASGVPSSWPLHACLHCLLLKPCHDNTHCGACPLIWPSSVPDHAVWGPLALHKHCSTLNTVIHQNANPVAITLLALVVKTEMTRLRVLLHGNRLTVEKTAKSLL